MSQPYTNFVEQIKNSHHMKKYKIIVSVMSAMLLTACSENVEKSAQRFLNAAEEALAAGSFSEAKAQIDSIKVVYPKAFEARKAGIRRFIPTGAAVQNARETALGDDLTRDGYHLSYGVGRYIAAATWYEALCHRSVVGNAYVPDGSEPGTEALTPEECRLAQKAVHKAVKRPFKKR